MFGEHTTYAACILHLDPWTEHLLSSNTAAMLPSSSCISLHQGLCLQFAFRLAQHGSDHQTCDYSQQRKASCLWMAAHHSHNDRLMLAHFLSLDSASCQEGLLLPCCHVLNHMGGSHPVSLQLMCCRVRQAL